MADEDKGMSTDNSVTQINTTGPSVSEEHVQQLINNILRIVMLTI